MQSHFDSQDPSEGRIALLEARLAEIQASREELRRELVRRACEPADRRSRVPARLALVFSLGALGMAAWGIGALLAPPPTDEHLMRQLVDELPVAPARVEDDTMAVNVGGPRAESLPIAPPPSAPEKTGRTEGNSPGEKVGNRGGRTKRPPKREEKPSIIETFSECGDDPLCGGID